VVFKIDLDVGKQKSLPESEVQAVHAGEIKYMLTLSCSGGIQVYNGYIHIYSGTLRGTGFKLEFLLYKRQRAML